MASTFRAYDRQDPTLDGNNKTAFILQRQFRGYKNQDPATKPQKAINPDVLDQLIRQGADTELGRAIGQLGAGAFFFAMRSCEYLKVSGAEKKNRRTKVLCLRNIRFFRNRKEMPHNDPELLNADTVSITFEYQKNDERDDTVTQKRNGDLTLCPVRSWATIVQRIRRYDGSDDNTPVCAVVVDGKLCQIPSSTMLRALRRAVDVLGKDRLGYTSDEIGTHSIRSGAAMAMYLDNTPVFTIMILGRWSSDAFLRYIRKQIQEFSDGVSAGMIRFRNFFTIPNFGAHRDDPRTPNNPHNFASRQFGRDARRHAQQPAFAVFH